MKILFITSRFPYPLEKGDKLRAFHFIKCLSLKHEVHLFALNENAVSPKAFEQLSPFCRSITTVEITKIQIAFHLAKACFSSLPFQVSYFTSNKAKAKLQSLQNEIKADFAFFHLIRTAEFADTLGNVPKLLDYMDTFSIGIKRRLTGESLLTKWLWYWEYQKLVKYEQQVFRRFNAQTIISEQDRSYLPILEKSEIKILPNGIDVPLNTPTNKVYQIIFAGNMSYPPNVEAVTYLVKQIMPIVWQKIPQAKVVIAGANPAAGVQKLASSLVEVTGWVENIHEYFLQSKILVAPMLISIGLQNKLLEAMANRVPCVTSTLANNALKATPDKQILIGNSPEEFAAHIVNLLENSALYERISNEGYRFVVENYSWQQVANSLNEIIDNTVTKK
jgi:sugar transferase (PEP-CTERM/EpsH1 system associated)